MLVRMYDIDVTMYPYFLQMKIYNESLVLFHTIQSKSTSFWADRYSVRPLLALSSDTTWLQ